MNDLFPYLVILGFLFLSGFFSGSETAFFSLTKIQLKKIEKHKTVSSRRISRLLKNPRELLIIILLGNTIVNVAASSVAALIAIDLAENYLSSLQKSLILTAQIAIMTILLLIFGEITPKLLAYTSPEKVARISSFFLEIIKYLLFPLIKLLQFISNIFSIRKSKEHPHKLTAEDFKNLIKSKAAQNSLEEKEKKIISSIFRFSSTTAREIMTPRVDIVAVEASEGLSAVKENIIKSGHSKIPVYKKNIDNLIGVIYAKDVILNPNKRSLIALLRPLLFVAENTKIQNLLNRFKTQKIQLAIIVDEYGGTSGLVTLEDILEELVGEITDEYDKEKPMISQEKENVFLVNGMYSIAEINEDFDLDIDQNIYDNLADFLYDRFNKVPKVNENLVYEDKVEFSIRSIKAHRIQYVRMTILKPHEESVF